MVFECYSFIAFMLGFFDLLELKFKVLGVIYFSFLKKFKINFIPNFHSLGSLLKSGTSQWFLAFFPPTNKTKMKLKKISKHLINNY